MIERCDPFDSDMSTGRDMYGSSIMVKHNVRLMPRDKEERGKPRNEARKPDHQEDILT
jgi:hypothetical protein